MALTETEIQAALAKLSGWTYENGTISKTYNLPSYTGGLAFAVAVGAVAEGLNHHPDMSIGYKRVTVTFTTHDSGNVVTAKDVEAARRVEALGYPHSA
jgi:4a-hydroxytetrahydrobiopterin dehydratase